MGNYDPYSDSPEAMVVKQPKFTRVGEPTLLCNHSQRKQGATDRPDLRVWRHSSTLPVLFWQNLKRGEKGLLTELMAKCEDLLCLLKALYMQ